MRSFLLAAAMTAVTLLLSPDATAAGYERGNKSFGVTAGYVTKNQSASAGLRFSYAFSQKFVLAPSVDYVFRHHDLDALLINIDWHGPWALTTDGRWYVYHILGVNYGSWSRHSVAEPLARTVDKDVTTRANHFGLDFGLGFALNVTPALRLTAQGKFNLIKDYNTGIFNLGIAYLF